MKPRWWSVRIDAVDVDAADRRHLGAGHGLLVGHDGERLEGRRRQARRLPLEHEPLDVGRQVGVALEAPTTGDRDQGEPAALRLVLRGHRLAQLGDAGDGQLEQLGEQLRLHRHLRDHQHGLDGPPRLVLGVRHQVSHRRHRPATALRARTGRARATRSGCRRRCAAGRGRRTPA